MRPDSADERRTHVGAGIGDARRVAPVLGQVSSEAGDGVGRASLGGEQHSPEFHVGEDAHVVLPLACEGLVHADLAHGREVLPVAGGPDVVLEHPPDPGVVLAGQRSDLRHRHDRGESQHQRLEQQREPRPRARPSHADLPHPVLGADHPRQPGMQQRPMLEKVQMPPRLVHGVMHRAATVGTLLGRTPKPGTTLEVQVQIQLGSLGVELAAYHPPRPTQPQRRGEQPQLIHTPTTPCYATITDSHAANETTTTSSTRHAETTLT